MKKTIVALTMLTGIIVACSPKVTKTPPPPPPAPPVATAATGSAEAGAQIISSGKCTKCHNDESGHVPKHTFAEQEILMQNMAKKAKLTEQETLDLMAYVKANAKS